jgi:hypothetical protein
MFSRTCASTGDEPEDAEKCEMEDDDDRDAVSASEVVGHLRAGVIAARRVRHDHGEQRQHAEADSTECGRKRPPISRMFLWLMHVRSLSRLSSLTLRRLAGAVVGRVPDLVMRSG